MSSLAILGFAVLFFLGASSAFGQAMTGADRAKADRAEADPRSKEGQEIRVKKSDQPIRSVPSPAEAAAVGAVAGPAAAARSAATQLAAKQAKEAADRKANEATDKAARQKQIERDNRGPGTR